MLFLAGALAIFVYGMIAAMLGTILPGLSGRFHLTPKQNGSIAFAQALGLMIASFLVGPLIDNEGKKPGLVLGLVLIAVALLALPRSGGFGSIATLLFVLGLGGGVVVTTANALIRRPQRVKSAQSVLRPGRHGDALYFSQPVQAGHRQAVLRSRIFRGGGAGGAGNRADSGADRGEELRAGGRWFAVSSAGPLNVGPAAVSLYQLRSGHMELAGAASDRPGDSGVARA